MAERAEIILGIDLGTTYSTAAALIGGKLHFALDGRGEACIPSVVHFPKLGPPLVGAEADKLRAADPANTVAGIKRVLGRTLDSPAARLLDAISAYKLVKQPDGQIGVRLGTRQYAATEVAAIILRHLRERAEARFGARITKAVLTVPVTATPPVRAAMVQCGKMAGLQVLRILSEPSAGALAYGFSQGAEALASAQRTLLIYDFGGGTFDATLVRQERSKFQVLAAEGDDCLGGDNFDLAFSQQLANQLYASHGVDVTTDVVRWDRLQRQCERVKRMLSVEPATRFKVMDAFNVGHKSENLDIVVRRSDLEVSWGELVDRSVEITAETIRSAKLDVEAIESIVLIGGTTAVPLVAERVSQAFARPCIRDLDPQTAVARGAALVAAQSSLLHD